MDNITMIIVVVALFALIIIGAFAVYRRRVKADIKAPGFKMRLDASNDPTTAKVDQPRKPLSGIFGNWSIGKTRMKVKGHGEIANNRSVGDTEMEVDETQTVQAPKKTSKKGK